MTHLRLSVVCLVAWVGACTELDPDGVNACVSDGDCLDGRACVEQICSLAGVSVTGPQVVGFGATAELVAEVSGATGAGSVSYRWVQRERGAVFRTPIGAFDIELGAAGRDGPAPSVVQIIAEQTW